ncbi:hypothetical protein [Pseudomonas sp. CF161]|uniref:hypothetical protein n=1 Tax=Pseudomonas sp. CF161 TaxID=911241 RepID=UPI00035543BD|nr:hypothetical protein [Pseudomonas sp. CF161]EPL04955.1 hypothetical protein CF161_23778 [Pseudomonas sp. CF161]
MMPPHLVALLEAQPDYQPRTDIAKATQALNTLGIALDSEFAQVYLTCYPSEFKSRASYEMLCDIAEPTEEVLMGTEFIHEVWELPQNFVAFTSLQGEGGYLLDKDSGGVWDFDLAHWEDFTAGRIPARWSGFFEFITWLLTAEEEED